MGRMKQRFMEIMDDIAAAGTEAAIDRQESLQELLQKHEEMTQHVVFEAIEEALGDHEIILHDDEIRDMVVEILMDEYGLDNLRNF